MNTSLRRGIGGLGGNVLRMPLLAGSEAFRRNGTQWADGTRRVPATWRTRTLHGALRMLCKRPRQGSWSGFPLAGLAHPEESRLEVCLTHGNTAHTCEVGIRGGVLRRDLGAPPGTALGDERLRLALIEFQTAPRGEGEIEAIVLRRELRGLPGTALGDKGLRLALVHGELAAPLELHIHLRILRRHFGGHGRRMGQDDGIGNAHI